MAARPIGQQRGIGWASPECGVGEGPPRLASPLSHCLPLSLAPRLRSSSIPRTYFFFFVLKTKLPLEKQNVDLRVLQLANPSVPGSAGLCGEQLRLGLTAQDPALYQPRAWRPSPLKGPFLGFLPAQICLVPIAVCVFLIFLFLFWGDNHPDDAWWPELCLF